MGPDASKSFDQKLLSLRYSDQLVGIANVCFFLSIPIS